MTYSGNIIDDEDSDDIFNEKMTDKIDELNANERDKSAVIDQLAVQTPNKQFSATIAGLSEQVTSAGSLITTESGKMAQKQQTMLIDTCQGGANTAATRAFDSGLGGDEQNRLDLSDAIDKQNTNIE